MNKTTLYIILPILLILVFTLSLTIGKADISMLEILYIPFLDDTNEKVIKIIFQHRLNQSLAAILTGVSLPVSGLLLQELFRNPLAGPSVFGITSASGLGVAVVIFLFGVLGFSGISNNVWVLSIAAFAGAFLALLLVLFFSNKIASVSGLIVVGFMIAGFASALIGVMQFFSSSENIKTYVIWGFGSLSGLTIQQIFAFALCTLMGLSFSILSIKGLMALQLGDLYAETMGVQLKKIKLWVMLGSAILTAGATAFVGPVGFIGLAIPHICRVFLKDYHHFELLFVTSFVGMILMLAFMMIGQLFPNGGLPINLIAVLFGSPIVVSILLRYRNL